MPPLTDHVRQSRILGWRQIEVFRAVMLAGSVSAAARQLGLSQPPVTRILRRAEDRLGMALFERRGGRLVPTPDARSLLAQIETVHASVLALDDTMARMARADGGLFRIGASPSVGRRLVPDALGRFRARYPKVGLHFAIISMALIAEYLVHGIGDCCITIFETTDPRLRSTVIGEGSVVCLLPPGHVLAEEAVVPVSALAKLPLIGFERGTPHGDLLDGVFAAVGGVPPVSLSVRHAESTIALVAAGLGVAVVDEFTAMDAARAGVEVRPVSPRWSYRVYVVEPRDSGRSRFVDVMEACLIAALAGRADCIHTAVA